MSLEIKVGRRGFLKGAMATLGLLALPSPARAIAQVSGDEVRRDDSFTQRSLLVGDTLTVTKTYLNHDTNEVVCIRVWKLEARETVIVDSLVETWTGTAMLRSPTGKLWPVPMISEEYPNGKVDMKFGFANRICRLGRYDGW